jgi:putative Holliday junction resolvase
MEPGRAKVAAMQLSLAEFGARLAPRARLIGLDLGTKTIGLAVSDERRVVATPLETVARTKFTADAERLGALIDARGAGGLIYGLPLNMDGTHGPRAQSVREFAREFARRRPLPYAFWDERLSTAAVQRAMIGEADLSRAKRAAAVDRAAAAYILQGALDALARRGSAA